MRQPQSLGRECLPRTTWSKVGIPALQRSNWELPESTNCWNLALLSGSHRSPSDLTCAVVFGSSAQSVLTSSSWEGWHPACGNAWGSVLAGGGIQVVQGGEEGLTGAAEQADRRDRNCARWLEPVRKDTEPSKYLADRTGRKNKPPPASWAQERTVAQSFIPNCTP